MCQVGSWDCKLCYGNLLSFTVVCIRVLQYLTRLLSNRRRKRSSVTSVQTSTNTMKRSGNHSIYCIVTILTVASLGGGIPDDTIHGGDTLVKILNFFAAEFTRTLDKWSSGKEERVRAVTVVWCWLKRSLLHHFWGRWLFKVITFWGKKRRHQP